MGSGGRRGGDEGRGGAADDEVGAEWWRGLGVTDQT